MGKESMDKKINKRIAGRKSGLTIRVIAGARRNLVKEEGDSIKVYVTAPPVEGRANKLVKELLADYFSVRKKNVVIVAGEKSSQKLIKITSL